MHSLAEKQRLRKLVEVFLQENAKVNLSAFRTEESCWIGNILDSLSFLELLPKFSILNFQFSILDVGTGGGFPLLPLAITLPDARFTGMDSTQKKVDAVKRIADAMNLPNMELIAGRAETLGRDPHHRERYDVVTARALAEIAVNLEYASPFVKPGGRVILWKSMDVEEEMKKSERAQKELACRYMGAHVYELPGDFGKRQLLIFEKSGKVSGKYPRAIGVAKKKPIG